MEWLNNILETLRNIFPRTFTVLPDEGGIRITFGTKVKPLGPGWYWYWPIIQHVEKIGVTVQIVDLRPQSVLSWEDKDLIISGAVKYRINDACKAILNIQDYDQCIQVLSLGVIAKFMHENDGPAQIDNICDTILAGIREEAAGFGLKIMKVYITDLGTTKNLRVFGDTVTVASKLEGIE